MWCVANSSLEAHITNNDRLNKSSLFQPADNGDERKGKANIARSFFCSFLPTIIESL